MINQFINWNTKELIKWVEDYKSCPLLQTKNNINAYIQALQEISKRRNAMFDDTYDISLIDYLCGNCPLKGCIYNKDGICICDNEDFLLDIFDYVRDEFITNKNIKPKITFVCNKTKVEEGYCIYCGAKLIKNKQKIPYGDTNIYVDLIECPNCGE